MYASDQVLKVIKTLISPCASLPHSDDIGSDTHNRVQEIFESCLLETDKLLSSDSYSGLKTVLNSYDIYCSIDSKDIVWKYVNVCLKLLKYLRESIHYTEKEINQNRPSIPSPAILSVNQQKDLDTLLQFIICLGICPYLRIGIPIEKCSKFGKLVHVMMGNSLTLEEKNERLYTCVKTLYNCSDQPTLWSLIITKHMHYLLAALLQIIYTPSQKLKMNAAKNQSSNLENSVSKKEVSPAVVGFSVEVKTECQTYLNYLIDKAYQPLLVKELMILMASPFNQALCKNLPPKSPSWLKKACSQLLPNCLMKAGGIFIIVRGLIENFLGSSGDWRVCQAIGQFIALCPVPDTKNYYKIISPQVLDLFSTSDQNVTSYIQRIACSIIGEMFKKDPEITQCFILDVMLKPLAITTEVMLSDEPLIVEEHSLTACISVLHKLFVIGSGPNEALLLELQQVIHPLYQLYCFCKSNACFLRSMVYDLLMKFLKDVDEKIAIIALNSMAFHKQKHASLPLMNVHFYFSPGGEGGAIIRYCPDEEKLYYKSSEQDVLLDLLKNLDNLAGIFFLDLCYEVSNIGASVLKDPSGEPVIPSSQTLMYLESEAAIMQYNMKLLSLVEAMSENIGPDLLKNTKQYMLFIKVTLERAVTLYDEIHAETLQLTLGLLAMILHQNTEIFLSEKEVVTTLIPLLEILIQKDINAGITKMAFDLKVSICTGSFVTTEATTAEKDVIVQKNLSEFEQAWQDLYDPLLPVRGHALIILHKLLQSKHPEALANQSKLLFAFQEAISHEDSYIYLSAIQALVSLTTTFPDQVVEVLTTQFAEFDSKKRSPELKMKLGEVLMKTICLLGDLTPKYSKKFIGAFLYGTKDSDQFIRASSLSNLGELCRLIRYQVGTFQHELYNCLSSILKFDPSPEARRAAALVITLLIRGLGKDAPKVLDLILKDLYRLLKLVYQTDKDDGVKIHIQLTLDELDIIMRDILFPEQNLQLNIKILDIEH